MLAASAVGVLLVSAWTRGHAGLPVPVDAVRNGGRAVEDKRNLRFVLKVCARGGGALIRWTNYAVANISVIRPPGTTAMAPPLAFRALLLAILGMLPKRRYVPLAPLNVYSPLLSAACGGRAGDWLCCWRGSRSGVAFGAAYPRFSRLLRAGDASKTTSGIAAPATRIGTRRSSRMVAVRFFWAGGGVSVAAWNVTCTLAFPGLPAGDHACSERGGLRRHLDGGQTFLVTPLFEPDGAITFGAAAAAAGITTTAVSGARSAATVPSAYAVGGWRVLAGVYLRRLPDYGMDIVNERRGERGNAAAWKEEGWMTASGAVSPHLNLLLLPRIIVPCAYLRALLFLCLFLAKPRQFYLGGAMRAFGGVLVNISGPPRVSRSSRLLPPVCRTPAGGVISDLLLFVYPMDMTRKKQRTHVPCVCWPAALRTTAFIA